MRSDSLAIATLLILTPTPLFGQQTTRISLDDQGNELSDGGVRPILSANGRYAAFTNLTDSDPADSNGWADVYVRDRLLGTTTLVSTSTAGVQGNFSSVAAAISADGRVVVFTSTSSTLVANDTNSVADVFVRDLDTGITERVSVDSNGVAGPSTSLNPALSPDGRYVCFWSRSALVPEDTNNTRDIYVHDRVTGLTERVSVDSDEQQTVLANGVFSNLSADGNLIIFSSREGLVAGDENGTDDVYLRDRAASETHRISLAFDGSEPDNHCYPSAISDDGRFAVYSSTATNLVAGVDNNNFSDVFLFDRVLGTLTRISETPGGMPGNGHSDSVRMSSDGKILAFSSDASDLVPGDTNGDRDAFRYDTSTGVLTRVSVDSAGIETNADITDISLSADGQLVAFATWADNLIAADLNESQDSFIHGPALIGSRYCSPAVPNSTGKPAVISALGSDSIALNTLELHAEDMPLNKFGYFLVSATQGLIVNPGNSQGNLCIGPPLGRFNAQVQNSGTSGSFSIPVDLTNLPMFGAVLSGDTWNFTCWYRDNNPGSTSNFTDGLEIFFP